MLAEGVTELRNAAVEPEIMDLICVLQKMGAIITVRHRPGDPIEGVDRLGGYTHRAIPDRIEAARWACAALATGGDIFVRGAQPAGMMTFLNIFRKVGGAFEVDDEGIRFWHPGGELQRRRAGDRRAPRLHDRLAAAAGRRADPGQRACRSCTRRSTSTGSASPRRSTRWARTIQLYRECLGGPPCRFGQRNFKHSAVISGPTKLHGADLVIPDLRGGFSHLIAALAAEGTSTVHGIDLINRGYENFVAKLAALGADYERG